MSAAYAQQYTQNREFFLQESTPSSRNLYEYMKREFRAGSIVKQKTGTTNMIVVKYEQLPLETKQVINGLMSSEQGMVSVTWFEQGRWKTGKFDPDQLELIN